MSDDLVRALAQRVQRVQDTLDIQQLAIRYAMAVDNRDLDAWLQLFIPNVVVGRRGVGREALREFIVPQLRMFYRSIHQIVGHRIDLLTAEHATGAVYCRAEHEVGDRWIAAAIRYDDEYQKLDGQWYFVRRKDKHFYEIDVGERPQDVGFHGWTSAPPRPQVPEPSATWNEFWHGVDTTALTSTPVAETT
jgi:3-phenylpropionate/cinnamic acid dioxygenase small subunit